MKFVKHATVCALAGLMVSGCATTQSDSISASATADANDLAFLESMLSGRSATTGSALDRKIEEAGAHPLGSEKNPVRAQMPPGQRAYLSRLKCADLKTPKFYRVGNFGIGVYGNIIDGYEVTCPGSTPEKTMIFMDMYHSGYVEDRPVDGFGIAGGRTADAE